MFQSFLIIGDPLQSEADIAKLLKSMGITLRITSSDVFVVEPLKKVTTLGQVREIKSTIFQKPLELPYKVVIFKDAHTLNTEAQNSLLKILEEPPASAILLLQTDSPQSLLPTIHSRVAKIWTSGSQSGQLEPTEALLGDNLLEEIQTIEDPDQWLSMQLFALTQLLKKQISSSKWKEADRAVFQINLCSQAKKMIGANVNPNFVLADLALSLEDNR